MPSGQTVRAIFGLIVLCYAVWRVWVWKSSPVRFRAILPPSTYLSWWATHDSQKPPLPQLALPSASVLHADIGAGRKESSTGGSHFATAAKPEHFGFAAAALDGTLAGFHAAEALSSIDTDVLKAIQASTTEHLHSLHSISDYVDDHFHDVAAGSAEGWLHRLEGYVAEQKAALTLEQAGHVVQFAPHANQAGWDLIVDGHAVQIKEGITAVANAKEALLAHPDIPVYTDFHSAVELKDTMVHGLPDLDPDAISTATESSLSGMQEGLNPDFSIPVVTLLRSSWREIKLLGDGKTRIERAVKNVAIDVGSVGAGMWAGAKAGLLVGGWLGPVGVAIAAVIGGVTGAIAGRKFADNFRMAPFKTALEEFRRTHERASDATESAVADSRAQVAKLRERYELRFDALRRDTELAAQKKLSEIERGVTNGLEQFLKSFPARLTELESQLNVEEAGVLSQMPAAPWWSWLFPCQAALRRAAVRHWFRSARKIVREERVRFEQMSASRAATLCVEVQRFLSTYTFTLGALDASLAALAQQFDDARVTANRIKDDAARRVVEGRNGLLLEFREGVFEIHSMLCQVMSLWKNRLEGCLSDLCREAEPLGIKLPLK
jgi:hypothetical protein